MIDVNQLRRGVSFEKDGELFKVQEYSHSKPARGKATIKVLVRNLRTGANFQMSFTSGDRVQNVRLENREFQYLYDDGQFYVFMNTENYEQKMVNHAVFAEHENYLQDNMNLSLLMYENEVLDYELPITMEFDVVQAENAIAGDTAGSSSKEIITETGLKVKTPLFVKEGDRIKVNTTNGEYVTRV